MTETKDTQTEARAVNRTFEGGLPPLLLGQNAL